MVEAIQTESTSVMSISTLPLSTDDPRTLIRNLTSSTDAGGVMNGHSLSTVNVPSVLKPTCDTTDKGESSEVSTITRSQSIPDVHVPSHAQTCGHSHQPFTFSRTKASNSNSPKPRRKSSKPKRNKMSKPRALRANDIVTGEPEQYSHSVMTVYPWGQYALQARPIHRYTTCSPRTFAYHAMHVGTRLIIHPRIHGAPSA